MVVRQLMKEAAQRHEQGERGKRRDALVLHGSARRRLSERLIRRKMSLASRAWFSGTAIVATGTATLLVVCCWKPATRRSRVRLLSTGAGAGGASNWRLRRPMRVDATAPSVLCVFSYARHRCVRTNRLWRFQGLEPSGAKTLGMRYSSEPCCYVVLQP